MVTAGATPPSRGLCGKVKVDGRVIGGHNFFVRSPQPSLAVSNRSDVLILPPSCAGSDSWIPNKEMLCELF